MRTGDIDNIGKTARHGTFFEMLGNFSFGGLLQARGHRPGAGSSSRAPTGSAIDPDRLYPSVFEDDDEAFAIWRDEIGIPPERIFRFGREDNFWEHGEGACGPCSEVYYDRGEKYGCGSPAAPSAATATATSRSGTTSSASSIPTAKGHYTELAHKNIDTGMGLERLACVCQDVPSLFDVDTVMNITHKVSEITGAHYGESQKADVSLRVITDHIRSATFLIGDGVLPSNEGRGLRPAPPAQKGRAPRQAPRRQRALPLQGLRDRHTREPHGLSRPRRQAELHHPRHKDRGGELRAHDRRRHEVLGEHIAALKAEGKTVLSGADAFRLYDTYGFPLDLTEDILSDEGMTADTAEFDKLMNEQRERARAARGEISGWSGLDLGLEGEPTVFTGYDTLTDTGAVEAVIAAGELAGELGEGTEGSIVLDRTPFYAEMGGQVADHGTLTGPDGAEFAVNGRPEDQGRQVPAYGQNAPRQPPHGDTVTAAVDAERRRAIMRAHSPPRTCSTPRCVSAGRPRTPGRLPRRARPPALRLHALLRHDRRGAADVARIVNHEILKGDAVSTEVMGLEAARAKGAQALFGEKYGESVRVVSMGGFSSELCGGTHIDNTAKVGPFRIESEFSVASGVRRIEGRYGPRVLPRERGK